MARECMNPPIQPKSIYFGGCAFGASFYVGVNKAMVDLWGIDYYKNSIICGDSGGALVALAIAMGEPPERINYFCSTFSLLCHEYGTVSQVNVYLEIKLRELLDADPLAYKKVEGRCKIGVTTFYAQHQWCSKWKNNEDLIGTVLYSCRIPFYFRRLHQYPEYFVDGAFSISSTDMPDGDNTLTVIVNERSADIFQIFPFPDKFFPIVGEEYEKSVKTGYEVMIAWDGTYQPKQQALRPYYLLLLFVWCCFFLERFLATFKDLFCNCHYLWVCYRAMNDKSTVRSHIKQGTLATATQKKHIQLLKDSSVAHKPMMKTLSRKLLQMQQQHGMSSDIENNGNSNATILIDASINSGSQIMQLQQDIYHQNLSMYSLDKIPVVSEESKEDEDEEEEEEEEEVLGTECPSIPSKPSPTIRKETSFRWDFFTSKQQQDPNKTLQNKTLKNESIEEIEVIEDDLDLDLEEALYTRFEWYSSSKSFYHKFPSTSSMIIPYDLHDSHYHHHHRRDHIEVIDMSFASDGIVTSSMNELV